METANLVESDVPEWTLEIPFPDGLGDGDLDRVGLYDWARLEPLQFELLFPEMAKRLTAGARRRGIGWFARSLLRVRGGQRSRRTVTYDLYARIFVPGANLTRGRPGTDHRRRASQFEAIRELLGVTRARAHELVARGLPAENVSARSIRASVDAARPAFLRTERAWTWWEERHRHLGRQPHRTDTIAQVAREAITEPTSTPAESERFRVHATKRLASHVLSDHARREPAAVDGDSVRRLIVCGCGRHGVEYTCCEVLFCVICAHLHWDAARTVSDDPPVAVWFPPHIGRDPR